MIEKLMRINCLHRCGKLPIGSRLYLGNLNVRTQQALAECINVKECVVVDDGTVITRTAAVRASIINSNDRDCGDDDDQSDLPALSAFLRKEKIQKIIFFSSHKLKTLKGDQYVENNYSFLRQFLLSKRSNGCVYIIGQPLVEDGIVGFEFYKEKLAEVQLFFPKKQAFYLPHPREDLNKIKSLISHLKIKEKHFNLPIEIALVLSPDLPEVCIGFFTSALFSMNRIFNGYMQLLYIYIPPNEVITQRDFVRSTYQNLGSILNDLYSVRKSSIL